MATYPLSFPNQAVAQETIKVDRSQAVMESPHSFAQQVVAKSDHWVLQFLFPRLSLADAEAIQGWLDKLNGQIGSFVYTPRQSRKSTLTGRTVALTAYSYQSAVSLQGWAASAPSELYVGQFVQIGNRLHRITTAPTSADTAGRCVIEVSPQIRTDQAAGTACEFVKPTGVFKLTTSEGYGYTLDPDRAPSFPTISAKEAL